MDTYPITEEPHDELFSAPHDIDADQQQGGADHLLDRVVADPERYMRSYRWHKAQLDAEGDVFDREIERLQARAEAVLGRRQKRLDFLQSCLRYYYESTGQKKVELAHGTLSTRADSERVEVPDEPAFCEAHQGTELVRVKLSADKTAIKAQVKATGDLPEGADLVRGEPTFVIKLADEPEGEPDAEAVKAQLDELTDEQIDAIMGAAAADDEIEEGGGE